MCGIVAYYGNSGTNLTRLLTAMSAIIYRAPDSSGIGFFGDDTESLRIIRSLGPVSHLFETLLDEKAYPDSARELMALWTPEPGKSDLIARQRRLLSLEGFSGETVDALASGETDYPAFDDLLDSSSFSYRRISPGQPGRTEPLPVFTVRSTTDLRELIEHLTIHYDLSSLAIQTLLRSALGQTLEKWGESGRGEHEPAELLTAFDGLFSRTFWEECKLDFNHLECGRFSKSPAVEDTVWRLLGETPVQVPSDYDRDAVRGLLRLLDAALLSRLPNTPGLNARLQEMLETFWPEARRQKHVGLGWRTLYWAEKGVNVYGWAAASALACLQQDDILPELRTSSQKTSSTRTPNLGETDSLCLRYLSSPVLSHGRWALQSPVTLENAHPFMDSSGQRAIALNGQFSGNVEKEAADFLQRVAGYSFRSQNSAEYFALLWGYYAKLLQEEKDRFEAIRLQVDEQLEGYAVGSQDIEYKTYRQIKERAPSDLDEMAFLQAAKRMIRDSELSVAGISLVSPRRLYVAAHNRPVFVVQRPDTNDFMVVSDVNAAMGLFPQSLIREKSLELGTLRRRRLEAVQDLPESADGKEVDAPDEKDFAAEESSILKNFQVVVYPLEGEKIFARIEAGIEDEELLRKVHFTDFEGSDLHEIKSFQTVLNPFQNKKELFKSFYESHLNEVPERLNDILRAYARDEQEPPRLKLKDTVLHRRFGHGLVRLKRILLVGMGSAHHEGLMAREFLQKLLPELEVLVLRPIEVANIPDSVVPEKDLVVLLSWSSTTADMVHFAKALEAHGAAMIAITGKRFADMALVAEKSAGVVQVLCGEEVTIGAVKSTFGMLFCLDLFGLWLRSRLGGEKEAMGSLEKLRAIPGIVAQVLNDGSLQKFARELAYRSRESYACLVFDALESTAAGSEIALKLQENSWSSVAKRLDYSNLLIHGCKADMNQYLVLVNATHQGRLNEALNVMKRLYLESIPFAAVSYSHAGESDVHYYSDGLYVNLPKVEDSLQPFVDLSFHYRFAHHYGVAHGRRAEESPRNRAKSVTTGRSLFQETPSHEREHQLLKEEASRLLSEAAVSLQPLSQETSWERDAAFEREKLYYREMRRMTEKMTRDGFAGSFLQLSDKRLADVTGALFEDLPEEGEIVFVSLDRNAHAAAKNVVVQWSRYLERFLRVAPRGESLDHFREDTVLIFVATQLPEKRVFDGILENIFVPCMWIGPEIPEREAGFFGESLGCFPFRDEFEEIDHEWVYAMVNALLLAAIKQKDQDKGRILEKYFEHSAQVVQKILNDDSLKQSLDDAMAANTKYLSALFCGPPGGTGLAWVDRFDRLECFPLEDSLCGEGAHGPLVTVDPRVSRKFIPLEDRTEMLSAYGGERVAEWEHRYLMDTGIDDFLERQREDILSQIVSPFFADGQWYLPVLQQDYDAKEDNLVIIDATCERNLDHALDEVATYGARYARMVLVTQSAFLAIEEKGGLQKQPVSHLVLLPYLGGPTDRMPIPELLLPFAMNLLCMRVSAAAARARSLSFDPISQESLFRQNFGILGEIIVQHGIDLGYLNHRLIDSLRILSPVISAIEGVGCYRVQEIVKEEQLHYLASGNRLKNPDKTISNFKAQQSQKTPFYLVRPDRKTFQGRVFEFASQTFQENDWEMWHEVYGDTWSVLRSRNPDIRGISEQESLLMIPFVEYSWEDGRLYHLYPQYVEWDHHGPLDEQIRDTAQALGKESTDQSPISARYREIVSHFKAAAAAHSHLWDDRLFILLRRSVLLGNTSRETVKILVERVQKLLGMLGKKGLGEPEEEIIAFLKKAWRDLQGKEALSDAQRWGALQKIAEELI